jgi:hypothetical protein
MATGNFTVILTTGTNPIPGQIKNKLKTSNNLLVPI